ncbi:hypothetical protein N9A45_00735 [bacterium]|nr:hypothetical protein [bacterium]
MRIVTVLGDSKVGKSALCQQWTSGAQTSSYMSTMSVDHYRLEGLTLHDTPSDVRFHTKLEVYLDCSDVFVLVGNKDTDVDHWWARIHPLVPAASWLFVWTGDAACPKRREWAKARDIAVVYVDLVDTDQVESALEQLRSIALVHAARPERVPLGYYEYLVGETRLWIPCV